MDVIWNDGSALLKCIPALCGAVLPGICVSLDPLPLKVRPLLNAQYFLDSCGIHFWKTKITVKVKAGQKSLL